MKSLTPPELSVVVPVYNEADGIAGFHSELSDILKQLRLSYEVVYVDDGSTDMSNAALVELCDADKHVRLLSFSRNFGKEMATTAGLHTARGRATLILDADGQHPVSCIPDFVAAWQAGAKVVVGRRTGHREANLVKRTGSKLFYGAFRRLTRIAIEPNASDFRLIDESVRAEFNRMTEHNRITRGLIDWLGYERVYISYDELPRMAGNAPYSFAKLFKLAIDSAISLSSSPLYFVAYVGAIILPGSALLGLGMLVNALVGDPLGVHATGGAYLMVFILFLVGILLVSQGIIGLYLSHIHSETQNRPLYIVDDTRTRDKS